jgi:nucleoside-diphosphate-sugar epimerase
MVASNFRGNEAGIVYMSRRDWDKGKTRRASMERAKRILGYDPKTRMDVGLPAMHRWFRENWENIQKSASF